MYSIKRLLRFVSDVLTLEEAGFINTRRLIRFFLFSLVFFTFIFGSTFVLLIKSYDEVQLKNVVGQDAITAIKTLQAQKLKTYIVTKSSPKYERFKVIKQKPSAGTSVKQNRTVTLTVSLGQKISKMPNFVGKNIYDAKERLLDLFSAYTTVPNVVEQRRYSTSIKEGFIIKQQPEKNSPIDPEENILFVVSRGIASNKIRIINYQWQNYKTVKNALEELGIDVRARSVFTIDLDRIGLIFAQSIPPKTILKAGDNIEFKVGIRRDLDEEIFKSEIYRVYSFKVPTKNQSSHNRYNNKQRIKMTPSEINRAKGNLRLIEVIVRDELGRSSQFKEWTYVGRQLDIPYKTYGQGSAAVYINGERHDSIDF